MKRLFVAFTLVLVLLASGAITAKEINDPLATEAGEVKFGEANIEYFSQGKGPVVVLLSGRALDVGYLEPLARALAQSGYRAVRINRRGGGKSTGSFENLTYHTHASDAVGVIRSLNVQSVTVLGHAVGNRVARTLDSDYPELVTSVVLLGAGGKVDAEPETDKATSKLFKPHATDDEISEGMKYMVGDPANSEAVWRIIKPSRYTNPDAIKSEASITTPLAEWWAPPGETPYLAVQGLRDMSAPPANARLLKEDLAERMTLVELPEAGHLALVENPDEVATAIVSFLNQLASGK
jgi:pimeloyl-ACP methyl ester carboxylesterase